MMDVVLYFISCRPEVSGCSPDVGPRVDHFAGRRPPVDQHAACR
jgi:hypothetical protein